MTKRRALWIVLAVGALLLALIILRSCGRESPDLSSVEGRQRFLAEIGWEIPREHGP